jgi:hypothetical protein
LKKAGAEGRRPFLWGTDPLLSVTKVGDGRRACADVQLRRCLILDKSLPETTAVREVLVSIKGTEVGVEETATPHAVSLKIEARGGGRVVGAEATTPLLLKITVMGRDGPLDTVGSDVVLTSNSRLSPGEVTLRASDFVGGVANASVQFLEAGQDVTLAARCGDLLAVSSRFVVVPALVPVKGTLEKAVNQRAVQDKTRKARAVLLEPPQNPGSEALANLRAKRPVTGVNSAGKNSQLASEKLGASLQGDAGSNCLCCTMGAITGQTSTALVQGMMRDKLGPMIRAGLDESWNSKDKDVVDAEVNQQVEDLIAKYGTMQDQNIWWRLESLENFMTNTATTIGAPSEDDLGDAQLRGTRGQLVDEARRRNAASGSGGVRYKVVQDGLADSDPDKSMTYSLLNGDMQKQMGKYPDGTQFQVYVFRRTPLAQHWLFAEKYNGKVVMEDYQKARPQTTLPKAAATGPTGYTSDDIPHNPIDKEQPDTFSEGYFLAICPESFDASQAWAGNEDWPQPTV